MTNPLWSALQPSTSFPLIWANQNADPPRKPYATYKASTATPLGVIALEPDADGVSKLYGPLLLRVELNFYGPGGVAEARRMVLALCTTSAGDRLLANGLSVARFVSVNDLSGVVDDPQSQERGMLELTLNATDVADDLVGIIEHVGITPDPLALVEGSPWDAPGCSQVISSPNATTPQPS